MPLKRFTLVLGGASSGKSVFAESLITGSGLQPVYVATAQAFDDEMRAKIAAHQAARGADWRTVETPTDPGAALAGLGDGEAVLIDCLTLWLSNLMLADMDVAAAEVALSQALDACPAPVVAVSNEVGSGVVPESSLGRAFRAAQGGLNQRMAARADLAVQVVAGLPMVLKGQLP